MRHRGWHRLCGTSSKNNPNEVMSMDPKRSKKPRKELAPDDPSRDENHDESRINPLDFPEDKGQQGGKGKKG